MSGVDDAMKAVEDCTAGFDEAEVLSFEVTWLRKQEAALRARVAELESGEVPVRPIQVGDVITGFCGGWFGRDSYGDKHVEAVGSDWVVAREDNGELVFAERPHMDVPAMLAQYRDGGDVS